MAVRIARGKVQLLTRSGLDRTEKYPATAAAFAKLPIKTAYIDGELCGVREDGVTSFELMQQASDAGYGASSISCSISFTSTARTSRVCRSSIARRGSRRC